MMFLCGKEGFGTQGNFVMLCVLCESGRGFIYSNQEKVSSYLF